MANRLTMAQSSVARRWIPVAIVMLGTTAAFPVALGYSYTADPFQCVHDGLRAAAGAGKGLATLTCK